MSGFLAVRRGNCNLAGNSELGPSITSDGLTGTVETAAAAVAAATSSLSLSSSAAAAAAAATLLLREYTSPEIDDDDSRVDAVDGTEWVIAFEGSVNILAAYAELLSI